MSEPVTPIPTELFEMKLDNGLIVSGLGADVGPVLHASEGGTLNGHRFEAGDVLMVGVLDEKLFLKINGRQVSS